MKTDMPEAALRLLCTLPVHTHRQSEELPPRKKYRARIVTGKGRGGNNRYRIKMGPRIYESMMEACKELRVAKRTIMRMVDEGKAVIL